MESVEQEESLREKRKRLESEESTLKADKVGIEQEVKSIGRRLEALTIMATTMQEKTDELEARNEAINSRLMEISDELDLIKECYNEL